MAPPDTSPAARLLREIQRPARLVRAVCRMILGLALAITLIVKIYMVVLTDHQCVGDVTSLGNSIRCTSTLLLMAAVLALSAGFDLAYRLCFESIEQAITPAILGLGGTFLVVLDTAAGVGFGWREALVVMPLTASLAGLLWVRGNLLQFGAPLPGPNETPKRE